MPELPEILQSIVAAGAHSWQTQLTVPMGRDVDERDVLLQQLIVEDVPEEQTP